MHVAVADWLSEENDDIYIGVCMLGFGMTVEEALVKRLRLYCLLPP